MEQLNRRDVFASGLGVLGTMALGGCLAPLPIYRFPFRLTTQIDVDGDIREAIGGGVMSWRRLPKGGMARDQESGSAGLADLGSEGRLMVSLSRYRPAGRNRWIVGHPWDPTIFALKSLGLAEDCDEDGDCLGLRELIRRAPEIKLPLTGADMPIVVIARAPWTLESLRVVAPPEIEAFVAPKTKILSCFLELKAAPSTIPAIQAALPWLATRTAGSLGTGTGALYSNSLQKDSFYREAG